MINIPTPVIDNSKCNGCKTCIEVCPMQVFSFEEKEKKAIVEKPKDCIGCRACEVQCPNAAIVIND